jgi:hypothetical protein
MMGSGGVCVWRESWSQAAGFLQVRLVAVKMFSKLIEFIKKLRLRFQVLKAASMETTVFWYVAPWSLVEVYRRFRGACCLHHHRPNDGGSKQLAYCCWYYHYHHWFYYR